MARPLTLSGSDLQEISDAQFDTICYWLRVAYAYRMDSSAATGAIFVGGSGTTIGSASDTSSTETLFSRNRNYNPGSDYPSTWPNTIGTETDALFTYNQNRTTPAMPSNAVCDSQGYLIHDGATGLITGSTDSHWSEILDETLTQLKSGDEVGSYRISTSSPGSGWTDKGVWFTDSTYSNGTTTYKLWLRTSDPSFTVSSTMDKCFSAAMVSGTALQQNTNTPINTDGFIWNVLLRIFQNRVAQMQYQVDPGAGNRGTFTDTKQIAMTNDQYFSHPTYYNRTKPSGASVVQSTWGLNLL